MIAKKLTIIIAVLEATVLLTMKLMDWKESKSEKPAAGKAPRAAGHRVVNPAAKEYYGEEPQGEKNAAYLPAGSSAPDEKVHKKKRRWLVHKKKRRWLR